MRTKKQEIQREVVEERIEIQSACNKKTHRDEQSDGQDRGSHRPLAEAETGLSQFATNTVQIAVAEARMTAVAAGAKLKPIKSKKVLVPE